MSKISKTRRIMILSVFALILLLTGSVVVDMYNKTDARADWQFHYFTGITSIITGVACIAYAMYTGLQTNTGKQIRAVQSDIIAPGPPE